MRLLVLGRSFTVTGTPRLSSRKEVTRFEGRRVLEVSPFLPSLVFRSVSLCCTPSSPVIEQSEGYHRVFYTNIFSGAKLSPPGTAATTGLLYQPQMIDDGDCEAIGGIMLERENPSTRRKPIPVPLCPPQIPHDLTRTLTRVAAVGSRRLTSRAMAQPISSFT
jgi:hypothetical protein